MTRWIILACGVALLLFELSLLICGSDLQYDALIVFAKQKGIYTDELSLFFHDFSKLNNGVHYWGVVIGLILVFLFLNAKKNPVEFAEASRKQMISAVKKLNFVLWMAVLLLCLGYFFVRTNSEPYITVPPECAKIEGSRCQIRENFNSDRFLVYSFLLLSLAGVIISYVQCNKLLARTPKTRL